MQRGTLAAARRTAPHPPAHAPPHAASWPPCCRPALPAAWPGPLPSPCGRCSAPARSREAGRVSVSLPGIDRHSTHRQVPPRALQRAAQGPACPQPVHPRTLFLAFTASSSSVSSWMRAVAQLKLRPVSPRFHSRGGLISPPLPARQCVGGGVWGVSTAPGPPSTEQVKCASASPTPQPTPGQWH